MLHPERPLSPAGEMQQDGCNWTLLNNNNNNNISGLQTDH